MTDERGEQEERENQSDSTNREPIVGGRTNLNLTINPAQ